MSADYEPASDADVAEIRASVRGQWSPIMGPLLARLDAVEAALADAHRQMQPLADGHIAEGVRADRAEKAVEDADVAIALIEHTSLEDGGFDAVAWAMRNTKLAMERDAAIAERDKARELAAVVGWLDRADLREAIEDRIWAFKTQDAERLSHYDAERLSHAIVELIARPTAPTPPGEGEAAPCDVPITELEVREFLASWKDLSSEWAGEPDKAFRVAQRCLQSFLWHRSRSTSAAQGQGEP